VTLTGVRVEGHPPGLLALLCSAMFLNILNLSSVNIALPDIAADLDLGAANLPWVISAYAVTFAGFLLVGGRVADLRGRRRVLAVGFATFAVFTVGSAVAIGPATLIAARGLQGVGAAIIVPAALGILTTTFAQGAARSRALGAFAAAGAVGFGCGLILGGVVTDAVGWRWVFGLTAPLAVVVLALTFVLVPRDPDGRTAGSVDLAGALSATAGLLVLVYALTEAGSTGWAAPVTVAALVGGIALLALFLYLQRRVSEPLMPFRIWALPSFAPVVGVVFCLYGAWTGVVFFLALTLQNVVGYSPTEAGLALLPIALVGYAGSTLAGRLLPRVGPRRLLLAGLAVFIAGIALMAFIDSRSPYWPHIVSAVTLAIAGNSLTFVACTATALGHAALDLKSLLGGVLTTSVQLGGGLGLTVVSAVAAPHIAPGATGEALLPGYHAAFWAAAAIATVGLLATVLFVRERPSSTAPGGRL